MTPVADDTTGYLHVELPARRRPGERRHGTAERPGSVGIVYKASGGLTHLILDITGYFR